MGIPAAARMLCWWALLDDDDVKYCTWTRPERCAKRRPAGRRGPPAALPEPCRRRLETGLDRGLAAWPVMPQRSAGTGAGGSCCCCCRWCWCWCWCCLQRRASERLLDGADGRPWTVASSFVYCTGLTVLCCTLPRTRTLVSPYSAESSVGGDWFVRRSLPRFYSLPSRPITRAPFDSLRARRPLCKVVWPRGFQRGPVHCTAHTANCCIARYKST